MTKRRRVLLGLILILAVLLLAGAASAALLLREQNSVSGQMARGQKYLAAGDYTNAVLCYQSAIDIDPDAADGYIGLAQVYLAQDKLMLAENVLTKGFTTTGSARIKLMLQNNFINSLTASAQPAATQDPTAKVGDGRFDYDLLQAISKNSYDDYRRNGPITSEGNEGADYVVRTAKVQAIFSVSGTTEPAIDRNTGKPYTTRRPSMVSLNDISDLFGGRTEMTPKELRDASLNGVKVVEDEAHGWIVTFNYNGCTAQIASDEDGTIHSGAWNEFIPAHVAAEGNITLSGRVVDATTGGGVSNAELKIRTGSLQTGAPLDTVKADNSGEYAFDVEDGDYTLEVIKSGYVTEYFPVHVNQTHIEETNLTITPVLAEGEVRIVLEWGSYPRDLDSYLTGRTDSGANVAVSYTHRESTANGTVVAELDVDDTNGYGPETTTIYDVNGVYSFDVNDFTSTGDMSQSGATVKVYTPDQSAPVVISICGGLANDWAVCKIDHGEVQVINAPG